MFHVYRVPVMSHNKGPLQWADLCKLHNNDSLETLCSVFEHQFNKRHKYCEVMVKIQRKSLYNSQTAGLGHLTAYYVQFKKYIIPDLTSSTKLKRH